MRSPVVALVLASAAALAVGACDGDESDVLDDEDVAEENDEAIGDARGAIVGGQLETGRPAVVALVHPGLDGVDTLVCSGVLITPTIVVTAAHCLHPQVTGMPADELVVVFGDSLGTSTDRIDVETGAYHPSWRPGDADNANDLGAVRLAKPAPVDPIALAPQGPSAGEPVVLVGFGDTDLDAANAGVKRSGAAVVADIGQSWFRMDRSPAITCSGDSGGATLVVVEGAEMLLGVHSRGDCETTVWDERMDVHAGGFLKSFMGEFGGCGEDGACAVGCPDPDPDCPCAGGDACNATCGDADPDCADVDPCEVDPDSEACECAEGDCQNAKRGDAVAGAGWGSAGCAVGGPAQGSGSRGGVAAALAASLALAAAARLRRRAR